MADVDGIIKFFDELKAYGIEISQPHDHLSQRIVEWVQGQTAPDWDALVDDFLAFALPEQITMLTEDVWFKFKQTTNPVLDETFREVDEKMKALPSDLRDIDNTPASNPRTPKSGFSYGDDDTDDLEDMAASYGAKLAKKVVGTTPKTRSRLTPASATPLAGISPALVGGANGNINGVSASSTNSFSSTPSSTKPASRTNSGSVLLDHGNLALSFPGEPAGTDVPLVVRHAGHSFKFMQQRPGSIAVILSDHIDVVSERLLSRLVSQEELDESFEGLANVRMPSQGRTIWVAGMVFKDPTSGQLHLQGSEATSGGASVELDLSGLVEAFSLFDGCCVVARGSNYSGRMFVAEKLLCLDTVGDPPPKLSAAALPPGAVSGGIEKGMELVVACGPFTTSEDLNFDLLIELIKAAAEKPPHFLILIGPLLDCGHPLLDSMSSNVNTFTDDLLVRTTQMLGQSTGGVTQLVYVASPRDVNTLGIFPTAPNNLSTILAQGQDPPRRLHCTPDPTNVSIGTGGLINATFISVDILAHMGGSLVESAPPPAGDRIGRIIRHMATQRSLYPLYPPKESVLIDYEEFEQHCFMPALPHLIFLPSNLRYFVKEIDGMVCVNPGKLAKGQTGGTYCRISIDCNAISSSDRPTMLGNYRAQIVKI